MPSTYTLNNGIELIGTGEQSGTWGDTTNTNLELLDTALDGQVTVTLSSTGSGGSPNTLPISDGSSSNGRNRLVVFNDGSDIGGTVYVQLTPNDAEKIIYVRNSLSGSRSILLFQGTYSASNDYEVPAGTTAVVFFNGAGSGAVAANVFNNAHFDALNIVGNAVVGGTLDVTGVATAASVVVDNITIDGNTISTTDTNGNLIITPNGTGNVNINSDTLAVSGAEGESAALVLNADEADDNPDTWRIASNTGNTLTIENQISGSTVSHLTITPNATVANSTFAVAGGLTTGGTVTANAGVVVDNITIDGTEIDLSSGDLTIDVAGNIILDADGGFIAVKDAGTEIGNLGNYSSDFAITASVQDKDIIFKGNDNGSIIDALTLDMSEAGRATFNNVVRIPTNLEHDGDSDTFFGFPAADNFIITAGNVSRIYGSATETVVNEDGADRDFRIETDAQGYAFFIDAASDTVTFSNQVVTMTHSGNGKQLELVSVDADANSGPQLDLYRNSASPANNDYTGRIKFISRNNNSQDFTAADFLTRTIDVSDGSEDASLFINVMTGGTAWNRLNITPTETVLNEESRDVDFRVESNAHSAALFVDGGTDGVGINSSAPISFANGQTVLFVEDTTNPSIAISDTGQDKDYYIYANGSQLGIAYADGSNTGSVTNATEIMNMSNGADGVIFNEGSADRDFRVESNSHAHFFYVDGGSNSGRGHITMGDMGATDTGNMVTISSPTTNALRAQIAQNGTAVELVCTDTDANAGPNLDLRRIATGANSDVLGIVRFMGGDNAGNTGHIYAQIVSQIEDATSGGEDGKLNIETLINNDMKFRLNFSSSEAVFNEGGIDTDFRVESDANANFLLLDASAEMLLVGGGANTAGGAAFKVTQGNDGELTLDSTSSESNIVSYDRNGSAYHPLNIYGSNVNINPTAGNAAIFNEASLDADFRVESDTNSYMLFVDAGNNHVNIGTSTDYGAVLNVFTTGTDALEIVSDNGNGNAGPYLDITRKSSSPADGDFTGTIRFLANNDAAETTVGSINTRFDDVSNASENSSMFFKIRQAGAQPNVLIFQPGETVVNEDSYDRDFRVESNSDTHALFVDAGNELINFFSSAEVNTGANAGNGTTIKSNGRVIIQTDDSVTGNDPCLRLGRLNHDSGETILLFSTNGDARGSITVSGGTVSYNAFMGSHITQSVPSDILEGTVLEATGELIDSTDEEYKGYVEQKRLTKCKVSDTEDSNNVYGVFQSEFETGLQYTASLGAFFVRIHSGETVSLGDLLSSKGDGTAKVQSDDVIRSKTIGKVTSLTKKTTYSDGSYLLPCVLYCG